MMAVAKRFGRQVGNQRYCHQRCLNSRRHEGCFDMLHEAGLLGSSWQTHTMSSAPEHMHTITDAKLMIASHPVAQSTLDPRKNRRVYLLVCCLSALHTYTATSGSSCGHSAVPAFSSLWTAHAQARQRSRTS